MAQTLAPTSPLRRQWIRRNGWVFGVYLLLVVMLLYERAIHATAFSAFDVQSLVDASVPLAMAAMAQASVVLAGGIDLAVGPLMSLSNVIAANLMVHASFGGALLISLALLIGGALVGATTGLVITVTRVPDIIVTLATSAVWGGVALQVMPTPSGGAPTEFVNLLTGDVRSSGFPVGVIIIALVYLVVWLPIRRTRPGLALYAMGSNRTAAFLSGVNVARTRILAYSLSGVFAVIGGLALTAQTGNGSASSGAAFTLNSVAAVVIGGVALTGGRGGMLGPIAAAAILTLLSTILGFLNVDPNYSQVMQGVVVVLAVMIGGFVLRRRA
ncbi:MAG: putative transporter permease protein [Chloroflexi bacterium]|jgi:ribose transport system permease protein|nr:putative transporter permease protein [Chloroflexota bacterium]